MRNTLEYPPTKEEIIRTLEECLDDERKRQANDRGYGDMQGVCLQEAISIVQIYYPLYEVTRRNDK